MAETRDDDKLPPAADGLGATVRRSAVTDTVVPAALDETVAPDAITSAIRISATRDTVLPPAAMDTVLPAGTDDTMAAPPGGGASSKAPSIPPGDLAAGGSSATMIRFDPGKDSVRTIGDDLRDASVERFGEVDADRYEVLGELARGGLGRVLRARDPRTGRVVAIKQVLRPNPELIIRFAREALVTANLQHPAIVPVYEVGRWHSGEPFYAMKLVRGRALDALIAEATTSAARVALVTHVIAIADALAYAHSEHVIHRDLKPANVLVGPYGETVVIDWGLARNLAGDDEPAAPSAVDAAPGETVAGQVMGTPAYMAPEQAAGEPLDERADVYAIGAILYHVLAGVRPYDEAATVDKILAAVAKGPPRPLAAQAPDVAPELIAIADKAMARARDARYPTALELAEDLRRFQTGQLVGAHRYSSRELVRRWLRRHRGAAATGAIALLALAAFGVISVRRIATERDRARAQTVVANRERADARAARELSEQRLGDSLAELGRQAALAGAPERALPFLAGAAAAVHRPSPALAVLLGQVRAAYDSLELIAPLDAGGTTSADLAGDDQLLLTTSVGDHLRAWDIAARGPRWTADGVALAAASPDGGTVLGAGTDGEVTLRGARDGAVVARWRPAGAWQAGDRPVQLAWSASGDRFAIGALSGRVLVGAPDATALSEGASHQGEVWSLAFAPGGGALASTAENEPLALRDPATGAIRARLAEAGATSIACAWRDAATLITVDSDRTARSWRVADRRVLRRFRQAYDLYGVAIAPDRTRMVTFGDGDSATLWTIDGAAPGTALPGHRIAVEHAAFAGGRLVTSDEASGMLVWDAATGELVGPLPGEGPVHGLTARGDRVVSFGEGRPRVWRLGLDAPVRRLHGHTARIRDLAFDEVGAVLWSASHDGSARGAELAGDAVHVLGEAGYTEPVIGEPVASGPSYPRGLRSLTLGPDRSRLYTAGEDGAITVWDRTTGAVIATWRGHRGRVRKVVITADGRTAFSIGDRTLRRWDVATGTETGHADLGDDGWDVAFLEDEKLVVTLTDGSQRLGLWDAATLTSFATPAVASDRLRGLVVAGDQLIVATPDQLVLIDGTGGRIASAPHGQAFAAAVGLADRVPVIAVSDARGEVVLHDRVTLAPVRSWSTGLGVLAAVAFRPDGRVLAVAGGRRAQLWDPATGQLLASSVDVGALITQLVWSPDGQRLGFAGGSGTIWVWQVPADDGAGLDRLADCVSPLRLEQAALTAATFDPARCPARAPR